jgi:membrane protein implicated in regulation of membrane protease activity
MTLFILNDWASLSLIEQFFWGIAILFSVLFILQLISSFVGGDVDGMSAEGDADISVEGDMGIDFQFFSLKNLVAFFTIFGWTGIICVGSNLSPLVSTLIATLAGLIMMLIMASIIYFMGKLTEDGSLKLKNAIGKSGTVYLPIPAKRVGMGQVQVQVQGLQTLDAYTDSDQDIPTGALVEVVDVLNDQILIVKPSV